MPKKITTTEFIHRSHIIHKNKYNYNKTIYGKSSDKVIITCPTHGDFLQRPGSHLEGTGCPQCNWDNKKIRTQHKLIQQSKLRYNDRYDYSKVIYTGPNDKVIVTCPTHGDFSVKLFPHSMGGGQCSLCGSGKNRTTQDFVILAKEVHGGLYDYSLVNYVNATTKVDITCKTHGVFSITPDAHLNTLKRGCPKCKRSTGEILVYDTLIKLGETDFICEKTFSGCVNPKTGLKLRFDFYLPDRKLLIEYDGEQHFKPINFSGKMSSAEMDNALVITQHNDLIKTSWAVDSGYQLLRIPYTDKMYIHYKIFKALIDTRNNPCRA